MGDPIGANPRIRQCATHLARKFHDTRERYRTPNRLERYDWSELPEADRDLLVRAFYSLVYSGSVICPVPEHRIGISLREETP